MADLARAGRWLLLALTITGVIVLGTLLASCSSSGNRDLVGGGQAALERTGKVAAKAAQRPTENIEADIDRFLGLFSHFDRASVEPAAHAAYAADAYFNDGFVEIEGHEAIAAYLAWTADATAAIEVDIKDRVIANGEVYLR
jgi:hypothetical protein